MNLRRWHRSILLHRLRHHVGGGAFPPDRLYPTFSIAHAVGACAMAAAACIFLRWSESIIPPLLWKWIELFEIREIFAVELLDRAALQRAWRLLALLLIAVVILKLIFYLSRLILGALVLLPDRLIAAEWRPLRSRVHHLPYSRVLRLSTEESLLHRLLGVGNLRLFTSEAGKQVTIGPIPGFSAVLARLLALLEAA